MSKKHSLISPSSAGIWVNCPGYIKFKELYSEEQLTIHAEEGELCHQVAETILRAKTPILRGGDIYDAAKLYADEILQYELELHIEEKVKAPNLHSEFYGTPDCFAYDKKNNKLYIWDLKYGMSDIKAFENWQLICYAIAVIESYAIPDNAAIEFVIVQPRCYTSSGPIKKWLTGVSDLNPYFLRIKKAINEIYNFKQDSNVLSGEHCKHCPGKHTCPAAQQAAYNAIDVLTKAIPVDLTTEQASFELQRLHQAARAIDNRIAGVESQIKALIESGTNVPNYIMKASKGREVWRLSPKEILEFAEACEYDLKKPVELITPTQARKKGFEIKEGLTERKQGRKKLVYVKDGREIFKG